MHYTVTVQKMRRKYTKTHYHRSWESNDFHATYWNIGGWNSLMGLAKMLLLAKCLLRMPKIWLLRALYTRIRSTSFLIDCRIIIIHDHYPSVPSHHTLHTPIHLPHPAHLHPVCPLHSLATCDSKSPMIQTFFVDRAVWWWHTQPTAVLPHTTLYSRAEKTP